MLKFAELVEQNMEELAYLETIAMGKPLSVLLGVDIPYMIGCYRCKISAIWKRSCCAKAPDLRMIQTMLDGRIKLKAILSMRRMGFTRLSAMNHWASARALLLGMQHFSMRLGKLHQLWLQATL